MDQFDRSRFYREHDHVVHDHARRSRRGPDGQLGTIDPDLHGRRLLLGAIAAGLAVLIILVLFVWAADQDRPTVRHVHGERAAETSVQAYEVRPVAVEVEVQLDHSPTRVRPPGWIPSGRLPTIVLEDE